MFERTFMPLAQFEYIVISDTNYIRDPEIYVSGGESQDPRFTRRWSGWNRRGRPPLASG